MSIEKIIRNKLTTSFIPLVKKCKCEICDIKENLHVHHIKPFAIMLEETLEDLNLEYKKDMEEYTIQEFKNIINIMLGKHLEGNFLTLCKECHKVMHNGCFKDTTDKNKDYYEHLKEINKLKRDVYIEKILIPYLNDLTGKRLHKDDKEELINLINVRAHGRQQKSYSKLNDELRKLNLPYVIFSKKSNDKRFWILERKFKID